jgi:hypothetical protein
MKLYRLYNQTESKPASALLFLKREDALKYQDLVRWPYATSGRWPLPGGLDIPLDRLELRVESVDLPGELEKTLALVVMEHEGRLGGAALLPGDCFDPGEWEAFTPEDLAHPVKGPLMEAAGKRLRGDPH